jgi:gamma-glutamylaminecyclotransferase
LGPLAGSCAYPLSPLLLLFSPFSLKAMHKVFVYGTLKSGYCNHDLLQGAKGYPAVAPQIDLYAGPSYPFAMRGQGQAVGEVYEVNNLLLKKIDRLEGHPQYYHRELTSVILEDGKTIQAWIYLNNDAYPYPRVADGNWRPRSYQLSVISDQ